MKLRTLTLFVAGYLLASGVPGCSKDRSPSIAGGGNSETHFLEDCTDRCPAGLACLCGVCTQACENASDCSSLSPDAACVATCTDAPTPLMCDVPCRTTADCTKLGTESSCRAGRCRFGDSDAGAGAAGAGGTEATTAGGRGGSTGAGGPGAAAGEAGSEAGATSGAGGAGNSNGGSGAGAGAGTSGAGLGPIEVTNATSFRRAQYSVFCEKLFGCPITEGDDPEITRLELQTPERCLDVLTHSPLIVRADRDLDAKLEAGEIELHSDQVATCLETLADCAQQTISPPGIAACRKVFRGNSLLGGPCSRPEDCAADVDCVVTTTCPGTCTERPLVMKPLGADCNSTSECDASPGDVECTYMGNGYSCELVTRFPPAKVDATCSRSGTELRPCEDGLYCEPGEPLPGETSPSRGTCRPPGALGATCDNPYVPCTEHTYCIDGTCQPISISYAAGEPCNATTLCNSAARLFCNAGVCELMGDGTEGARCRPIDLVAIVSCEPGLVCLNAEPDAPIDPTGGFRWSQCGKPHAAGDTCQENDDCESQHCLSDHTCGGDTYCCSAYSCQSN